VRMSEDIERVGRSDEISFRWAAAVGREILLEPLRTKASRPTPASSQQSTTGWLAVSFLCWCSKLYFRSKRVESGC
jgi:hypothetical protein